MVADNAPDTRKLHVQRWEAALLAGIALLAVGFFGRESGPATGGVWSAATLALAACLAAAVVAAYQFPLPVSRHSKIYLSSVAYFLLAVLLPPPLAAAAAGFGALIGEISVQRRRGTYPADFVMQASRRTLIVLAGALVAHVPAPGVDHSLLLVATALILWLGDVATFPLVVGRLMGEPPARLVVKAVRQSYLMEGAQYLLGLLGVLAGAHRFSTLALLVLPTMLVYLAFRATARAQEARSAAQAAADALQESEARYRALFQDASDLVYTHDLNGTFTAVNHASEQVLGYSHEDLLTTNIREIVAPDQLQIVQRLFDELKGGVPASAEFDMVAKDGRRVNIDVNARLLYRSGRPVGVQAIARDVTERRRAERERTQQARDLAARVLQAQEEERKRIARELHDETAQALSILLMNLDLLEPHMPPHGEPLRSGFDRVRVLARRVLDETRALSHNLRPPILDDVGLEAALRWLAAEYEQTYGGTVDVDVPLHVTQALTAEEELALFRITQEALTNSGKHAAARRVRVRLSCPDSRAELVIEDDGSGFDLRNVRAPSRAGGLGLYGMRERAGLLGGRVEITAKPLSGTRVVATIPLNGHQGVPERIPEIVGAGSP